MDTDLYKFTTSYAYSKLFPRAFGEFEFVDRSNCEYPERKKLHIKATGLLYRVTQLLKQYAGDSLYGTSNVYMAYKHNLSVSGTHPHEWIQFHGSICGYKMAN